jgi:hypothetical protein
MSPCRVRQSADTARGHTTPLVTFLYGRSLASRCSVQLRTNAKEDHHRHRHVDAGKFNRHRVIFVHLSAAADLSTSVQHGATEREEDEQAQKSEDGCYYFRRWLGSIASRDTCALNHTSAARRCLTTVGVDCAGARA